MKKTKYAFLLFLEGCSINIKRMKLYSSSLLLETFANLFFVGTVLLFWDIIYDNFSTEKLGLTQNQLYVYLAFVEIFIAIKTSMFGMTGKLWRIIYSGQFLSLLIRPMNPIALFLLNFVRFHMLFPPVPIILYLLYQGRDEWTALTLFTGILLVFIGVLFASLIEITFSTLSFWGTKMNALDEIVDSFLNFTKYPLTVFTYGWQLVFTVFLPFMFYATIPTYTALSNSEILYPWFLYGGIAFLLWVFVLRILWKEGMKRYDGFSG